MSKFWDLSDFHVYKNGPNMYIFHAEYFDNIFGINQIKLCLNAEIYTLSRSEPSCFTVWWDYVAGMSRQCWACGICVTG